MNELEVVGLAIAGAIWVLIIQHVTLRKTEASNDHLHSTLRGLAAGKLEAKIDTDGDIAIRLKRDQLGEK